jgi:hypothetical protein
MVVDDKGVVNWSDVLFATAVDGAAGDASDVLRVRVRRAAQELTQAVAVAVAVAVAAS